MTICMNGAERQIPDGATLENIVDLLRLKKKSVVIELNTKVIGRDSYAATTLCDRDVVEIVHFVGGG